MAYLYLGLAIFFEVIATSFLKAAQGFSVLVPSLVVVLGYVAAFYFLGLSLVQIPIGAAYAIWAGLGIVLIGLVGYFFFHQNLNWAEVLGMAIIILGVAVVKLNSSVL